MTYCIRLLSPVEKAPSAVELDDWLRTEGFPVSIDPHPGPNDWGRLTITDAQGRTLVVRRHLRRGDENPVDEEVDSFLDHLLEMDDSPAVRRVEEGLREARQMLILEVPDDYPWGTEQTLADAVVQVLAERTKALVQADGEGFYTSDGELILELD
ncbi:MAG: hypothetical protein QHJ73_06745 [Armatimonadota bacterium]|jgi:hypothetical protein|nr:hypothetical protein [Armatimonadota bacterium]